jgi:hypothetical protein
MVIINETSEGEKEVLLNLFDWDPTMYDRDSTIFFHKKIHGSVDLSDQSDSARWLKAAKTEIAELIF